MSSSPSSRAEQGPQVEKVRNGIIDPAVVERAANLLKRGGVVAMRTDTVYGLLASVGRPDALRRLVEMKVRPDGKPFVILAADWIGVRSVTSHLPAVARYLGSRYWPGPLTLILPGDRNLPDEVTAVGPTVAVRVPSNELLRQVVTETRNALAAPSANLPGDEPATTAEQVIEIFGPSLDLVLDGGPVQGQQPSTIVNCAGRYAEIIRPGPIVPTADELRER